MRCLAILVNYRCAQTLMGAVQSLADDPDCERIHVIDNSVSAEEAEWLRTRLPTKAQLSVSPHNLGFARACNLAYASDDADCILLLNPDARLLPGALKRLKQTLAANPRLAAVGPRVYWDDERRFLLPPTTFPSAWAYLLERLGPHFPFLENLRTARFRARALREWQTEHPFRVNALSGGHVLLRRTALAAAGGLFDENFFMYWEDSDLMRRLTLAGFELCLEPRAQAIHHYEHSPRKDELIAQGWPIYAAKHFSGWGWRLFDRLSRPLPTPPLGSDLPFLEATAAGDYEIAVPQAMWQGWLLEYSPAPSFLPSIGALGSGPVARLPAALARRFSGRCYYLRLGDRQGRICARYRVEKIGRIKEETV